LEQLLSIFGYLSVLARGVLLSLQTLLVGGVGFLLLVAHPALQSQPDDFERVDRRLRRVLFWTASIMAVIQVSWAAFDSVILMSTAQLPFRDVMGAEFFLASVAIIIADIVLAILLKLQKPIWTAIPSCLTILLGDVATGHSWSRLDYRLLLSTFSFVHQLTAGIWIGGVAFLLMALGCTQTDAAAALISKRFSRIALVSVAGVLAAGIGLSLFYIDSPNAAYGTAYGIMVMSKVALFALLVGIGALNKSIVERLSFDTSRLLKLLRRNVEAEIGIGFTVLLAAASLTSQPPAVDLTYGRLTGHEAIENFSPRWPRLSSPNVNELAKPTRQILKEEAEKNGRPSTYAPGLGLGAPETPAGKAWSEYNHNWAGLLVFAMGILAVASRSGRMRWARHWPLVFIGLAIFIFLRADPENWPLGPNGFWESCLEADVMQHRFFSLLTVGFAIFEWRVQTGRSSTRWHAYVFPAVCAIGGAMLFSHSHSLGNIKAETLVEWSHIPLAFLAVLAGWSRWAELRTAGGQKTVLAWTWSLCFVLIGSLLMLYREV
jgi:copper resistance protein D